MNHILSYLNELKKQVETESITTQQIEKLGTLIKDSTVLSKELLSVKELAYYMDCKADRIHKLTHHKKIPYYKPFGKVIYFKKAEIEQILLSNRIHTRAEISKMD